MGKKQKSPNDMRSDSMNPNNLSKEYLDRLRRLADEARKLRKR